MPLHIMEDSLSDTTSCSAFAGDSTFEFLIGSVSAGAGVGFHRYFFRNSGQRRQSHSPVQYDTIRTHTIDQRI
jgi:hypothetical protein